MEERFWDKAGSPSPGSSSAAATSAASARRPRSSARARRRTRRSRSWTPPGSSESRPSTPPTPTAAAAARRSSASGCATKGADVRDRIVIATKTFNPMDEGEDHGLAPHAHPPTARDEPARLGVERVALYLAHDFDPDTPQEETLRAFDELVRAGKVGAVGASNFTRRAARRGAGDLARSKGSRGTSGRRTRSRCSSRATVRPSSRSAASTASATRRSARSPAAG